MNGKKEKKGEGLSPAFCVGEKRETSISSGATEKRNQRALSTWGTDEKGKSTHIQTSGSWGGKEKLRFVANRLG